MTDSMIDTGSVCIVMATDINIFGARTRIFGVYTDEKTARSRVKELDFNVKDGVIITYHIEQIWRYEE